MAEELAQEISSILKEDAWPEEYIVAEYTNRTPALVGSWLGHASTSKDKVLIEPPRPTDIAGKTRFWLRSLLTGKYYNETGRLPSPQGLEKYVGKLMGNAGDKDSKASHLVILVEKTSIDADIHRCISNPGVRVLFSHYRTLCRNEKLFRELTMSEEGMGNGCVDVLRALKESACLSSIIYTVREKKNPENNVLRIPLPPNTYKFYVKAYIRDPQGELSDDEKKLLGYSLAMALLFSGIGRKTTRGFGKLSELELKGQGELYEGYREAAMCINKHAMNELAIIIKNLELPGLDIVTRTTGYNIDTSIGIPILHHSLVLENLVPNIRGSSNIDAVIKALNVIGRAIAPPYIKRRKRIDGNNFLKDVIRKYRLRGCRYTGDVIEEILGGPRHRKQFKKPSTIFFDIYDSSEKYGISITGIPDNIRPCFLRIYREVFEAITRYITYEILVAGGDRR